MTNLRIVHKVLAMLVLMAALAIGLTAAALFSLRAVDRDYSSLLDHEATASLWLARSNSALNAAGRNVYLIIAKDDEASIRQAADALDSEAKSVVERLNKAREALPAISTEVATVLTAADALITVAETVKTEAFKNNDAAARAIVAQSFDPAYVEVRTKTRTLIDQVDQQAQKTSDIVSSTSQATMTWMLAVAVLGLVVVFALAAALARKTIAQPVEQITRIMSTLASGSVDVTVAGGERSDEIGGMARAVQVFKDNAVTRLRLEAE
ncbi:HAMP domain-containing protein, partial [Azospirillum picis]